MAQDRVEQIKGLLAQEQDFQLWEDTEGDELEHREKSYEYRDLLLELRNALRPVLKEPALAMLEEIDTNIYTVTAVKKARSQLKGIRPDIKAVLNKLDMEVEQNIDYVEHYVLNGEYSTPYIDLMIRAIKELKIDKENQPAKSQIENWFKDKSSLITGRDASSMATFVRLPEKKKGGYYKSEKKKDDTPKSS